MRKRSDFERILMNIAVDTSGSVHSKMVRTTSGWDLRVLFGNPVPQFMPLEMAISLSMPLAKGDIVRCQTNPNHHWGISVFVERLAYSKWLLQEIGGNALMEMDNEGLDVLRFMNPSRLYTGHQHKLYLWASRNAFSERYNPNADYFKRCGGVDFDGNKLIIWSRPHIWCMERAENGIAMYAQPKKFTMEWGNKTRLRDIVTAMNEQGFGDDFVFSPDKPNNGQGGITTFTREKLTEMLQ